MKYEKFIVRTTFALLFWLGSSIICYKRPCSVRKKLPRRVMYQNTCNMIRRIYPSIYSEATLGIYFHTSV